MQFQSGAWANNSLQADGPVGPQPELKRWAPMLIKRVDLKKVRKALRYERVREVVGGGLVRYEIDAANPDWPGAYLVLAPEPESGKHLVLQAGFGEWHEHFDEYRNPDRNVGAALAFLADIVSGRVHLVAGYDAQGRYVGGELLAASAVAPNMRHGVLGMSKAVSFKSFGFNRAPEAIGV